MNTGLLDHGVHYLFICTGSKDEVANKTEAAIAVGIELIGLQKLAWLESRKALPSEGAVPRPIQEVKECSVELFDAFERDGAEISVHLEPSRRSFKRRRIYEPKSRNIIRT